MTNLVLGIDPGLTGAFAIFDNKINKIVDVIDAPTFKIKNKLQLDLQSANKWLQSHAKGIEFCCIELVHAMPKQGVVSTFNFGRVFGQVEGLIAGLQIPVVYERPEVWKSAFRLRADKEESRQLVLRLFPDKAHFFTNRKDHGKAEAVLLAIYGAKNCRIFE